MSIITPLAQTTQLQGDPQALKVFLLLMIPAAVISICLAARLKVHRGGLIAGPPRTDTAESPWTFLLLFGIGLLMMVCGAVMVMPVMAKTTISNEQQGVIANIVGSIMAVLAILVSNTLSRDKGMQHIGLSPTSLSRGILLGLLGLLIAFPAVFWSGQLVEFLRVKFYPDSANQHDLFKMWKSAETSVRGAILLSAVVIAPITEEVMMRGLLQTFFASAATWFARRIKTGAQPSSATLGEISVAPLPPAPQPANWPTWPRWTAVILTSIVFALTHHPIVIQIPIFILAMALGYLYERTGNLWAVIFMHAAFNAAQFAIFLTFVR